MAIEYREGDFYYRDSFAGFLASHGQETVWYQDKPVWMCSYAGGMRGSKSDDADYAHETFEFLKKAMRTGEKSKDFQPRGPKNLKDGDLGVPDADGECIPIAPNKEMPLGGRLY